MHNINEFKLLLNEYFDLIAASYSYQKIKILAVKEFLNFIIWKNKLMLQYDELDFTYLDNPNIISQYLLFLKKVRKNSGAHIRAKKTAIKQFYQFLIEKQGLTQTFEYYWSNLPDIELVDSKRHRILSHQELKYLINKVALNGYYRNPYFFKALIYFLYYTGLQEQYFKYLFRIDFDLGNNTVYTPDHRQAFYPESVKKLLITYFNSEPEKINAFNLTTKKLATFRAILRKYKLNKKNITIGYFKDNFRNLILKYTKNPLLVQKLTGVKDIHFIMQRYGVLEWEEAKDIYLKRIKYDKE